MSFWYLDPMKDRISTILKMRPNEQAEALSGTGFSDGRCASQNIDDIKTFQPDDLPSLIEAAIDSPNPDSALNYLERFLSGAFAEGIDTNVFKGYLPIFIKLFGSSDFLSSILVKRPFFGLEMIKSDYLHREKPLEAMKAEIGVMTANISDYKGLLSALRLYKQKEMLRIGIRDLLGYGTLEEITSELSSLASSSLDTAYTLCLNLLKRDYGVPYCRDADGNLNECGFVVLGMGKLGGNELNFSSDIDLIYLYESDEGETKGNKTLTLYEFYCKLAELLTKAIASNTEEGFVFRVDLRLRPEGQNGPIVNSVRNAEGYYESWGETWERSAMLKARPVAGDIAIGESFLKGIEPFVYRKYLDFSTIEDIKEMKLKIDRDLALRPGMWDVKLGSGGIREIEFLVQATQLIHAGKDRSIRERNTIKSLEKLNRNGLLSDEDHETMKSAYRFLRTVEHRIQIENEMQTHLLPTKAEDMNRLAKRCGFKGTDDFSKALYLHSKNVERLYDGIFHEPSKSLEDIPADVAYLFSDEPDKDDAVKRLGALGFEKANITYERLQALREASPSTRLTQRDRKALRRLAPRLFLEASKSPDPDMAITNLDRFLSAVGAKGSFYSLLIENPNMVRFLSTLFGTSDFLSQFLISHPELLDTLLRADTVTPIKSKDRMRGELTSALSKVEGYEEVLDAVRRFRNTELIRIGINDIAEVIGLTDVSAQLTYLSELSLEEALRIAEKEVMSRFGTPLSEGHEASMSVIGMGKLGGGEMNYSSDLDMIFIYSGAGETRGPKVIANQEYFAKVAQRVISFLTLQTREGYLYKVDTRLRPSGSAGTLVSSLDAFRRYHRESAKLWERQALIKARVVAGDTELGKRVTDDIASFVYGKSIDDEGRKEMIHLRERMEKELAKEGAQRYNLKTGRGGIVDIEFAVQFLQLRHGKEIAVLRKSKTLDALQSLFDAGLMTSEDYSALKDAYTFLMRAENRLRIVHNISTDQMEMGGGKLSKLARRLGYRRKGMSGPQDLFVSDYRAYTEKVREIYNSIIQ